ncbi:hypothetical protein ACJX0J_042146, partial [Zea mays]
TFVTFKNAEYGHKTYQRNGLSIKFMHLYKYIYQYVDTFQYERFTNAKDRNLDHLIRAIRFMLYLKPIIIEYMEFKLVKLFLFFYKCIPKLFIELGRINLG